MLRLRVQGKTLLIHDDHSSIARDGDGELLLLVLGNGFYAAVQLRIVGVNGKRSALLEHWQRDSLLQRLFFGIDTHHKPLVA